MFLNQKEELHGVVQWGLLANAAVALVVGVGLLGLIGHPHRWLDVDRIGTTLAAGVFVAVAVGVLGLALYPYTSRSSVQYLAFGNIAGGLAVWAMAIVEWDRFTPAGQWFVGATADAFVLLGLLEFVALWLTRPGRTTVRRE